MIAPIWLKQTAADSGRHLPCLSCATVWPPI